MKQIIAISLSLSFLSQLINGQNGTITGTEINCEPDHMTDPQKHDCGPNYIITGINTESIKCMHNECTGTTFNITTPAPTFDFESETQGFKNGILISSNVKEIGCEGFESCAMASFDLECLIMDGCDLDCNGLKSCYDAKVNMTNGKKVTCTGEGPYEGGDTSLACFSAEFLINGTIDGLFEVDCEKRSACEQTTWDISVGPVPSGKENNLIQFEFDGPYSGKDVTIVVNAVDSSTSTTALLELDCSESDSMPACDNIAVTAGTGVDLTCIAYCEPGACGTITGCTKVETLKLGNNNNKKLSTKETTTIIAVSSITSVLLVIALFICCYLKNKKQKTQVSFEKHNINENDHDIDVNDNQTNTNINTDEQPVVTIR